MSQVELAEAVSLTRQSVGAIEAGRATPSVDVALRLARAVGQSVESLFGASSEEEVWLTEIASMSPSGRMAMTHLAGRWVAHGLGPVAAGISADALGSSSERGGLRTEFVRPSSEALENVAVMGCAAGLGLLSDRLNKSRGPGRFLWLPCSSTAALDALAKQQTHVAGVHLVDGKTGDENVADVRRIVGEMPVGLITLGRWEIGFVVPRGQARSFRPEGLFCRRGVRLALREKGAGARRVFEQELRRVRVSLTAIKAAAVEVHGHLEVAQAVALGAADTGVATRDAAIAFGLDFVPLAEERYDLVIPRALMTDVRVERLLDELVSRGARRELESLGYDVTLTGSRVAEVNAA